MQNTFTLGVVWEFVCVFLCVCVLTNLLHVSHLHCCRPFAAPLLDSLVHRDPTSPPPLLLLLFPSSAALSLKVLFTASSAVHSLFGYRLPSGRKLYSSLCLPVRLHRRSPSSIFPLYPLPFIPFFFIFSLPLNRRFWDPSIEISHLHCLPLSSLSPLEFCPFCSEEAEEESYREGKNAQQETF